MAARVPASPGRAPRAAPARAPESPTGRSAEREAARWSWTRPAPAASRRPADPPKPPRRLATCRTSAAPARPAGRPEERRRSERPAMTYTFGPLERRGSSGRCAPGRRRRSPRGAARDRRARPRAVGGGRSGRAARGRRAAGRELCAARRPHAAGMGPGGGDVRAGGGCGGRPGSARRCPPPGRCDRAPGRCPSCSEPPRSRRCARRVRIVEARLPRPHDRGALRALRPAADGGAGVPGARVLAARRRGAGAAAGALGACPVGRRAARRPADPMDRAHGARRRATSSRAGCTPSATRRSRRAARR